MNSGLRSQTTDVGQPCVKITPAVGLLVVFIPKSDCRDSFVCPKKHNEPVKGAKLSVIMSLSIRLIKHRGAPVLRSDR